MASVCVHHHVPFLVARHPCHSTDLGTWWSGSVKLMLIYATIIILKTTAWDGRRVANYLLNSAVAGNNHRAAAVSGDCES